MNELRTMLDDTVTRLFGDLVSQPLLERVEKGEWPAELWQAVEECGLTRPHLPDAAGGADGTWRDAYVILRACGHHTVPLPVGETILAGWLLHAAGIGIPDGPLSVAPTPVDPKSMPGTLQRVPWGRHVAYVVVAHPHADGLEVGLVSTERATITEGENIAREPRDDLAVVAEAVEAGFATLPADAVQLYGAMIRSAQMAGALDTMLAQAVQYVGEREQFGRPIGKFQAIQQELAKLAGHAAASGTAAETAFRAAERTAADATVDPAFEIAVAKVRVGEAAGVGPAIAHQVHGAIGFTYEHALHFASRRLWAWRAEFGTEAFWAARLGRDAIARGADALWPFVTAR